eukprot:IDg5971t1
MAHARATVRPSMLCFAKKLRRMARANTISVIRGFARNLLGAPLVSDRLQSSRNGSKCEDWAIQSVIIFDDSVGQDGTWLAPGGPYASAATNGDPSSYLKVDKNTLK